MKSSLFLIVFVSLVIDLIAFTLILPLMPSLLDYYEKNDKNDGLYSQVAEKIKLLQSWFGVSHHSIAVLLGGILGSLFSLLQFISSPIIGSLSDVYGRKLILLASLVGEAICYTLWVLSTDFSIFVLSRIVGGISRGNVSISIAIMADITSQKTRSKGMAAIGIAFSLAFIIGPFIGAMFSQWHKDDSSYYFIWPAMLALCLTILNIGFVSRYLQETLKKENRAKSLGTGLEKALKYIKPSAIFNFEAVQDMKEKELKKMQQIGLIYFLYLFLYSGLEYTLCFVTHLRFEYTSMQQGRMLFFIGLIMAAVQGGLVRRLSLGQQKNMSLLGIALLVPSFIFIGLVSTTYLFYGALALYSFASATVVPCLTTMISIYASQQQKGTVLGIFRSLGALARAVGPILSSIAFWLFGDTICYALGGIFLIYPLLLLYRFQV